MLKKLISVLDRKYRMMQNASFYESKHRIRLEQLEEHVEILKKRIEHQKYVLSEFTKKSIKSIDDFEEALNIARIEHGKQFENDPSEVKRDAWYTDYGHKYPY